MKCQNFINNYNYCRTGFGKKGKENSALKYQTWKGTVVVSRVLENYTLPLSEWKAFKCWNQKGSHSCTQSYSCYVKSCAWVFQSETKLTQPHFTFFGGGVGKTDLYDNKRHSIHTKHM
jgi:hypothetical protein